MELTEQDAHCIARFLQGAIFGNDGALFNGCTFCKFKCGNEKDPAPNFDILRERFSKETGVDLSFGLGEKLPFSKFPYKKFLKAADDETVTYFKNYFATVR